MRIARDHASTIIITAGVRVESVSRVEGSLSVKLSV